MRALTDSRRHHVFYDLTTLEEFSRELGFSSSFAAPDELEVSITESVALVFQNLPDEEDTIIGFKGTPWHSHGKLMLMLDKASCVELDELDILQGIKNGDIVIGERYLNNMIEDRWLAHNKEPVDVRYIQAGEEIRIWRLAEQQMEAAGKVLKKYHNALHELAK